MSFLGRIKRHELESMANVEYFLTCCGASCCKSWRKSGVSEEGEYVLTTRTRLLAKLYLFFFCSTTLLCAIVTFAATAYTPKNDLILRFFTDPNLCAIFDYYPANVVGLFGFLMWMAVAVLFNLSLGLTLIHRHGRCCGVFIVFFLALSSLATATFIDVFAADLYEDGHTTLPSAREQVLLKQSNASSLELLGITGKQANLSRVHIGFYWAHGFSELIMMTFLLLFVPKGNKSGRRRLAWFGFFFFTFFGVGLSVLRIGLLVFHNPAWRDMDTLDTSQFDTSHTTVEEWNSLVLLLKGVGASTWAWSLPLFIRLYVPATLRVRVHVTLDDYLDSQHANDHWSCLMMPERFIQVGFVLLIIVASAAVVLWSLGNPEEHPTGLILAAEFSKKPGAYMFLPFWSICLIIIGLGQVLISVRRKLLGLRSCVGSCVSALWLASLAFCLIIVVPQLNNEVWVALVLSFVGLTTPLWFFVNYASISGRCGWRLMLWLAGWFLFMLLAATVSGTFSLLSLYLPLACSAVSDEDVPLLRLRIAAAPPADPTSAAVAADSAAVVPKQQHSVTDLDMMQGKVTKSNLDLINSVVVETLGREGEENDSIVTSITVGPQRPSLGATMSNIEEGEAADDEEDREEVNLERVQKQKVRTKRDAKRRGGQK